MRLLLTIPHSIGHSKASPSDPRDTNRSERARALTQCVAAVHRLFGGLQYVANLTKPFPRPANSATTAQVDIILCTCPADHAIEDLALPRRAYSHVTVQCDPKHLGFECHALLRDRLGKYDYYGYLEDDLILRDAWFFAKLRAFVAQAGVPAVLQPNRYEVAQNGSPRKAYIDGELVPEATAFCQDIKDHPQIVVPCFGIPVVCRRTTNPHSGCFFLNQEQMEHWSRRPFFLDRDSRFFGPSESAATLGIMRAFRLYKPADNVASFLEIERFGDARMRQLAARDARVMSSTMETNFVHATVAAAPAFPAVTHAIASGIETDRPTRRLLIQSCLLAQGVVDSVRMLQPSKLLSTIPGVRVVEGRDRADLTVGRPEEEKVFVWERPILGYPGSLKSLRSLLRNGYLIVVEYDDDFHRRPEHKANHFLTFRGCHCVQTSTEELAQRIREFNPNVGIFPNQIACLPEPRVYQDSELVSLVFGALNRERDWAPIMPTLNEVLRRFAGRVRVKVIHDRKFFDALATGQKEFVPLCPYDKYMHLLQTCDIGLLPLEPTPVNLAKSDVKFIENAACGVAVLASITVYEASVEDGQTGMVYRSLEEFKRKLTELLENPGLRQSLGKQAYEYVRDHRLLSRHYMKRYDWYVRMLDALPQLNEELASRVPELSGSAASD